MSGVEFVRYLIVAISWIIVARVLLSWFMVNASNRSGFLVTAYQVLVQITEPILAPIRRVVPRLGMVDISPMVAIILLWIIEAIIDSFV